MAVALRMTQPPTTSTDQELVAATRCGDDRAFEELFSRYRVRITGYCARITRDQGLAEDIAQEVFISALRRLRADTRPIAFRPWIYEIARNACIDEYRRSRRAKEVSFDESADPAAANVRPLWAAPAPEVAAESKQQLDDLRGAFRGLSESHHRIIVLRELEGRSYSQIGEELGMSKVVVESTLFRARRRLGEEYEELSSGRRCARVQGILAEGHERPLRSLGIRERRALTHHLEHCQPCRRSARGTGIDDLLQKRTGFVGKVAALLPFPWLRLHFGSHRNSSKLTTIQSINQVAPIAANPASLNSLSSLTRAGAAVAALIVAGVGGGVATRLVTHALAAPTAKSAASANAAASRHVAGTRSGASQSATAGALSAAALRGQSQLGGFAGSSHRRFDRYGTSTGAGGTAAGGSTGQTGGGGSTPGVVPGTPDVGSPPPIATPNPGNVPGTPKPKINLPTVSAPSAPTINAPSVGVPSTPSTGTPTVPSTSTLSTPSTGSPSAPSTSTLTTTTLPKLP